MSKNLFFFAMLAFLSLIIFFSVTDFWSDGVTFFSVAMLLFIITTKFIKVKD